MYSLQNGVLRRDGKPLFALGQSYYPSYHPQKVPVLPEGDRIGEMEADLVAMKEAGFHLVRMAALGDVVLEGDAVHTRFDLPDAFCRLCDTLDIAAMIRLQGYSMNLRGFDDATMLDQNGNPMPDQWSWFVRNCLSHPGIAEDNANGTVASAAHFKDFASVVSFQIYNEPAYPGEGFYDYHPYTVEAYRRYLKAMGHPVEDPPRRRPHPGEDPTPWIRFRLFSMQTMTDFLCDMCDCAREGYALPENLTCHMSCPISPGAAIRSEDYFETARRMDILGITAYIVCRGPSYHLAGLQLALAESAAALFGKHTWLIEYNARTNMPPQEWERETYAAIGHGLKGILYYQWRADYPFEDGPEPEGFGLLMNDGSKTQVFNTAMRMNKIVNRLGSDIATAETARSGLGVLYSNHANAYADALDNRDSTNVLDCAERSIASLRSLYAQLSSRSIPTDFVRACDLSENTLNIRMLLLPTRRGLSEAELDDIDAYQAGGGHVFCYQDDMLGFIPYARTEKRVPHGVLYAQYDLDTLLSMEGIVAPARVMGAPCADTRMLLGDGYAICCIINYDPLEKPLQQTTLQLQSGNYTQATAYGMDMPEQGQPLTIVKHTGDEGCTISLPRIAYGAMIYLKGAS